MTDHDLEGRVILITGANTGIGRCTALALGARGAHVVIAGRSKERVQPVCDEIEALEGPGRSQALTLDLGDFDSIKRCTDDFAELNLPLHVLINNAGLAGQKGQTKSGFELSFGVNHVGHFLFTTRLFDALKAATPSRVVTVASQAHYKAKQGIDYSVVQKPTQHFTGFPEYCVSKLANVLFSAELSRRLEGTGVTTYSLHPGVVASDIWRKVPWPFRSLMKMRMITNEEGAQTSIYCASEPSVEGTTGKYYDKCQERDPSTIAQDPEAAKELWEKTEAWTSV